MTTTSFNIYQQITSVRLASTANLSGNYFNGSLNNGVGATLTALSVGALAVDGINVNIGDRVLLRSQTNLNENGIYQVNAIGGPTSLWQIERSSDFQSVEQLKVGQYFSVGAGNTLAGAMYVLVEPLPSSIGTANSVFNFVDVSTGGSGPYLTIAGNLSDLSNNEQGFTNLGLGSGNDLIIDEIDFIGGLYTLTNPCPNLIFVNATTPGNAVRLPPVGVSQSFIPSQGPVFFIQSGFEGIDVQDSSGSVISPLTAPGCEQFVLTDNSISQGVWFVRSFVSTINGQSGDIILPVGPINSPAQLLYVSNDGNDLTGDGTIGNPFASYETARLFAVAASASASSPYVIQMIGVFNIIGNMTISPFIYIIGKDAVINVSGQILLDSSWDSTITPLCSINNLTLSAVGGINFTFNVFQSAIVKFFNVSFFGTSIVSLTGSGTNANPEQVIFYDCLSVNSSPTYTATNLLSAFVDCNIENMITAINNSAVTNSALILQGNFGGGISGLTLQTTNTGTLTALLSGSFAFSSSVTVDGTNVTMLVDSSSYIFTPTFLNGATLSQINLISLSDGVNANVNFTPINYTPVAGAWLANSVTGNLAGIDAALATASDSLQSAYNNGNTITVENIDNTRPVAFGRDETNPLASGVYISATRNLEANPTLAWNHFFEANNTLAVMTPFGSLTCIAENNTSGSEAGSFAMGASVSGSILPFFIANGQNSTGDLHWNYRLINDTNVVGTIRELNFTAQNDTPDLVNYATIRGLLQTNTTGSENGGITLGVLESGSFTAYMQLLAASTTIAMYKAVLFNSILNINSQNIINVGTISSTGSIDASAQAEFDSTSKGLLMNRVTTAGFAAIGSKATGLLAYDTDKLKYTSYNGTSVKDLAYTDDSISAAYTPTLTNITGTSVLTLVKAQYSAIKQTTGNIVIVNLAFTYVATATTATVQISNPFGPIMGNINNACLMGGSIAVNGTPAIGDGVLLDVFGVPASSAVQLNMLTASGSGQKNVSVSYSYIIQ